MGGRPGQARTSRGCAACPPAWLTARAAPPIRDSRPRAGEDHRLDYILLYPGLRHLPQLQSIEVLKWSCGGRQISDHFGVMARFSKELRVDLALQGAIARIEATIASVQCIEESDEVGDDTVSFRVQVTKEDGTTAETKAPKPGDGGEYAVTVRLTVRSLLNDGFRLSAAARPGCSTAPR
jgi:hypothetical protein